MFSILAGALGLLALDTLVSKQGSANVGALTGFASKVVRWFLDPTVPGIPVLAGAATPTAATGTATATNASSTTTNSPQPSSSGAVSGAVTSLGQPTILT